MQNDPAFQAAARDQAILRHNNDYKATDYLIGSPPTNEPNSLWDTLMFSPTAAIDGGYNSGRPSGEYRFRTSGLDGRYTSPILAFDEDWKNYGPGCARYEDPQGEIGVSYTADKHPKDIPYCMVRFSPNITQDGMRVLAHSKLTTGPEKLYLFLTRRFSVEENDLLRAIHSTAYNAISEHLRWDEKDFEWKVPNFLAKERIAFCRKLKDFLRIELPPNAGSDLFLPGFAVPETLRLQPVHFVAPGDIVMLQLRGSDNTPLIAEIICGNGKKFRARSVFAPYPEAEINSIFLKSLLRAP